MSGQEIPQGLGQLKALLVGINSYLESNKLSYCVQDATSLQEVLFNSDYGMNEKENIKLMVDGSDELNKPIRNNILNNVGSLSKNAQIDDVLLFFFAGHGMDIDGEGFILPSDFRQETGAQGGISIREIREELTRAKAKFKLIFLDACHSGSIKGRAETGKMTRDFYNSVFPAPKGFAMISACKQQEYSYEWPEKEHGVFSFYLLESLTGKGDENGDGFVDLLELQHYVIPQVQQWAWKNDKVQTPVIQANFSGILTLTKAATRTIAQTTDRGESDVSDIRLITEFQEVNLRDYEMGYVEHIEEPLRDSIRKISADLLKEFKPSQLEQTGDKTSFPGGFVELAVFKNEYRNLAKLRIDLRLSYSGKDQEVTDKIVNKLDDYSDFWKGIGFDMGKLRCNMDMLRELCIDKGYSIEKFQKKTPQTLVVRIDTWTDQTLNVTFIMDDELFIGIETKHSRSLSTDFYTLLNPKNIAGLFGTALSKR